MKYILRCSFLVTLLFIPLLLAKEPATSWHQYDPVAQTETWQLAPDKKVTWSYDAFGNRKSLTDWTGTTQYTYDWNHCIASCTTPSKEQTTYIHDHRKRLQKILYPSGKEVTYFYTIGDHLDVVLLPQGAIKYLYDEPKGLLRTRKLPNGIITEYEYDTCCNLSDITHKKHSGSLIAHFHFEYDPMGNLISSCKTTPHQTITTSYKYDKLYRLIEASDSNGFFEAYTYDSKGNRSSKKTAQGTLIYEYDEKGLLKRAGNSVYSYDEAGYLKQKATSFADIADYTFNELGQLVRYTDSKHSVAFTYNGHGERTQKVIDDETTIYYSYDQVFSIPQVLEERKNSLTRTYFYGNHRLGYLEKNRTFYYLEGTPHHSVSFVVDEQGNIVEELEYDPFGSLLSSSTSSSFGYNEEQRDPETGLIFLRTRYYDPQVGRFISPDPIPGSPYNPQSLNRYAYVCNNPCTFIDPMGTTPEAPTSYSPSYWAIGQPLLKEGHPLPAEKTAILILCVRDYGTKDRKFINEKEIKSKRDFQSRLGHAWLEYIDAAGSHKSFSVDKQEKSSLSCLLEGDHITYQSDLDVISLGFIVPEEVALAAIQNIQTFSETPYNVLLHNCVHATGAGAKVLQIEGLFQVKESIWNRIAGAFTFSSSDDYPQLNLMEQPLGHLWEKPPHNIYKKIYQMIKTHHIKNNLPLPTEEPVMERGSFGGISLSKQAELKLNLREIHGVVFDEATEQLIVVGEKEIQLPKMQIDDVAVAVQSIYGLKKPEEDPGVSIDPKGKKMSVRYLGATYGTEFGKILFDGDYTLKMLFLGKLPCHVPDFLSFPTRRKCYHQSSHDLRLRKNQECSYRTWIVPEQISLIQSPDEHAMVFETIKMQCLAESICNGKKIPYPPHKDFAQHFTDNYDAIALEYPIFSEVKRLGQITGIVKWIKNNNLPFSLNFFQSYQPKACPTPLFIAKEEIAEPWAKKNRGGVCGGIDFILNNHNFFVRQEESIADLKDRVLLSRPLETDFTWDVDRSNNLIAEVYPLFKTRKVGDFKQAFLDIEYPVPGDFPLQLVRFYHSFCDQDRGFGIGWTAIPFELLLTEKSSLSVNGSSSDTITVQAPLHILSKEKGEEWIYTVTEYDQTGKLWYLREDGKQRLCENPDHTYTLSLQNKGSVSFDHEGVLTHVADRIGITTHYIIEDGKLMTIRHKNGKEINLQYADNRVVAATSPQTSSLSYQYDHANQLSAVLIKNTTILSYDYDKDYRLCRILLGSGEVLFEGSYDDYNRLTTQKIGNTQLSQTYNLTQKTSALVDPSGITLQNTYDKNYSLIGQQLQGKDLWNLDSAHNQAQSVLPKTQDEGWSYEYEPNLFKAIDPAGNAWTIYYYIHDNALIIKDPTEDQTAFIYDEQGHLKQKIRHIKNLSNTQRNISYEYDFNYLTTYEYNELGRLAKIKEQDRKKDRITILSYDANGLLSSITLPSGYRITRDLDEDLRTKNFIHGGRITHFSFDELGNVTENSLSGATSYTFSNGQLTSITDRCGYLTEFFYDNRGHLDHVKDAEGQETYFKRAASTL